MFEKLKSIFKKPEPVKTVEEKPKKPRKPKTPKVEAGLSEKEMATANGEPYINITKLNIDPNNINSGEFELDWNDKFIINLIKAGYKQKETDTDQLMVDRWFQTVARNIALEVYEQAQADPDNRDMLGMRDMRTVAQKDLGNGRTEVS
jgi:hypothetical protein